MAELDTTNPLNKGVSYDAFLKNVKGRVTLNSLLRNANLTKDETLWIKSELTNHNKNK
tara:strand:+ start:1031 stop:1204 length:174 start_codon:yes stop_codon:yes gene_type:complete